MEALRATQGERNLEKAEPHKAGETWRRRREDERAVCEREIESRRAESHVLAGIRHMRGRAYHCKRCRQAFSWPWATSARETLLSSTS